MSSINESISLVRSVLLNPKSGRPTLDQLFTNMTFEFQQIYNELASSNLPWSHQSVTINVAPGTESYLVPVSVGKVLFAYADSSTSTFGPVGLEIVDLAEVTSDFYPFTPLDYGISRDFNELWTLNPGAQIALYRQDGNLYIRLAPFATGISSVTLAFSTGNWLENLTSDSVGVLPEHHMLAVVRTAMNLLPGAEWTDERDYNLSQRQQLALSLDRQEQRYARQFMYAKRNMAADAVTTREPYGGYY